jgi:hypothetical protein
LVGRYCGWPNLGVDHLGFAIFPDQHVFHIVNRRALGLELRRSRIKFVAVKSEGGKYKRDAIQSFRSAVMDGFATYLVSHGYGFIAAHSLFLAFGGGLGPFQAAKPAGVLRGCLPAHC